MKRWSVLRLLMTVLACTAGWALVAMLCMSFGSTGFGWPDAFLRPFREDNVLIASLVGAALAAAGVTYQAILRNPLADPYLLGVSSGASLAVYLWPLLFGLAPALVSSMSQQAFAFVGAAVAVCVVFLLSQRAGLLDPITLLLVGVIVNALNGSIYLLLYHLNLQHDLTSATGGPFRFLVGGINTNLTHEQRNGAAVCIAVGWVVLAYVSGQLNAATLSEAEAESLGVRIHRLRWVGMIAASLVTASAVAVSGPIGFVGLICPHLARLVCGSDHRRLLPVATALGACLLALADAASRALPLVRFHGSSPLQMLPVGVLTALLGGPFFLFLLLHSRRSTIAR